MLLVSSFSSHFLRLAPRRLQPPSICRLWLDLHLLQVFVGGVFVAVVLHLVEVPLFGRQHGVDLGGDRAVLSDSENLLHVRSVNLTCCCSDSRDDVLLSPPRCRDWWCRIAFSSKAPGWSQSRLLWPRRSPAGRSGCCCQSWSPPPGGDRSPNKQREPVRRGTKAEDDENALLHKHTFISLYD